MRVALVPGVLALLPEYAGVVDPVSDLRTACVSAMSWLAEAGGPVAVVGSDQGIRLANHLADQAGVEVVRLGGGFEAHFVRTSTTGAAHFVRTSTTEEVASLLVVGNGSAMRTDKAPGHFDDRAAGFDAELRRALSAPDPAALAALDQELAAELWADVAGLAHLGAILTSSHAVVVDYDDDPFGVQYWVMRWQCAP